MKELQPSAQHCFVCGVENKFGLHIRFYTTSPGEVTALVTLADHYQSYPGVVHGGIIATMLDEVASRTVFTSERIVVTAKMDIRYRKPVPVNSPLRLVGRLLEDKGKVCKTSGQLFSQDDTLLAEADLTLVEVAPEFLGAMTQVDEQGWQVYPEDYEANREVKHDH
jgi:acyl-coenzyme A thioesterase PaaI-like protein